MWHVMGQEKGINVLVGRTDRNRLKDLDVDGRIILKWIFKTWNGGHGLD
jgi:hypothetical protein